MIDINKMNLMSENEINDVSEFNIKEESFTDVSGWLADTFFAGILVGAFLF